MKFPDFYAIETNVLSIKQCGLFIELSSGSHVLGLLLGAEFSVKGCLFLTRFSFLLFCGLVLTTHNRKSRKPVIHTVARLRPCQLLKPKLHIILQPYLDINLSWGLLY